jgi:hypothetical protein
MRFLFFSACLALVSPGDAGEAFPQPPGIKGLQVQMTDDALALGIHHAAINVNVTALLESGSEAAGGGPRTWKLREAYLASLDAQIRPLSERGVVVYLILIAYPSGEPARDAVVLHPGALGGKGYSVAGFNAETEAGRSFLEAAIGAMAGRWNGSNPQHGRVWGWICGNEVNSHGIWYHMGAVPLPEAVASYQRAFRIVSEAVRRHQPAARVYTSFDHHWGAPLAGSQPTAAVPGRAFLDAFAAEVKRHGDLPWHVAWHPYPDDLGNPRTWADGHVDWTDDSPKVTFRNLEVLTRHLERPALQYEGKPRRVILSEQGFHTLLTPEGESLQAAAYAYAWEKCRRMPLIDAFIYHRHVDHAQEGGLRLGLWRNAPGSVATPHSKKQVWELFRKAGTAEWEDAAAFALPVAGLTSWNELAPR